VDVDLLNEHLARYAFAARLARGKRVLDAGCGAGYGSAELAGAADSVVGVDVAPEAIAFATAHYQLPNLRFEQGSCTALPNPGGCFDLVVAFEVIEHLTDWRAFLAETRRVLAPNGQLVVSTPNRLYYTESRGPRGANPFHVHEFDFAEFCAELLAVFPHVSLFLENHVEGVTFQPHTPGNTLEVRVDAGEPAPDESHFFVAVCANRPQIGNPTFVYVPRAANVLRERERHIALLGQELGAKDQWLDEAQQDLAEFDREHQKLLGMFRGLQQEMERANQWAASLNQEVEERRARVVELQEELVCEQATARRTAENYAAEMERANQWAASLNREVEERRARVAALQEELAAAQADARRTADGYAAKVEDLEADIRTKTEWAASLNREIEERRARVVELQEELERAQADGRRTAEGYAAKVVELETESRAKTEWAVSLSTEVQRQTEALATTVGQLHLTEKDLEERTAWALRLQEDARQWQEEARQLGAQVALLRASRWVKLGRKVGLGPDLPAS
jgi:SAM-dependent methyltransferase